MKCRNRECTNELQPGRRKYCSRVCQKRAWYQKRKAAGRCSDCGKKVNRINPRTGCSYALCIECQSGKDLMDKEQKKAYDKEWYAKNAEKSKAQSAAWQRENKARFALIQKKSRLRLTQEEIERFASECKEQKGRCKICGKRRKLYCDHNHSTGCYRGAICNKCNVALAFVGDDPQVLKAALVYLGEGAPCE